MKKVVFLCLIFAIYGCTPNEDIVPVSSEQPGSYFVQGERIQELMDHTHQELGNNYLRDVRSSMRGSNGGLMKIDFSKAILNVNNDGEKVYAFRIKNETTNADYFYNLIIAQNIQGEYKQPYFLLYEMTPDFHEEYLNGASLSDFRGTVTKLKTKSKKSIKLSNGDDAGIYDLEECPPEDIGGGDNDSGGGGPGGSGDPNDSDDPSGGGNTMECIPYIQKTTTWTKVCSGGTCELKNFQTTDRLIYRCSSVSNTASGEDPCELEDEEVPILEPDDDRPCWTDPIIKPRVAAQLGASKLAGGRFTVNGIENKFGESGAIRDGGARNHFGTDLETKHNQQVFSILSNARVAWIEDSGDDSFGKEVGIYGQKDGENVTIMIGHFYNFASGLTVGQEISTNTLLGYAGGYDSNGNMTGTGNLISAVKGKWAVPHIHIEVKVGLTDPSSRAEFFSEGAKLNNAVDPELYIGTEFDENGEATDCDNIIIGPVIN